MRRGLPTSERGRVALGAVVAALALLVPAAPAPAPVLLYQNFAHPQNPDGNLIIPFRVGETGGLTQLPFVRTGGLFAEGIAIRNELVPGNEHLPAVFAANFNSGTVSAFLIRSDGSLAPVGSPVPAGPSPMSMVVSPDGRFLYTANHIFQDPTITGFRISPTGGLTPIGSFPTFGNSPWGLSVSPHGVLYAVQENSGSVAAMRIGTDGRLTHLPGSPVTIGTGGDQLTSSDVAIDGRFLFVTAGSGPNQGVWSLALNANGTLASPAPITRASSPVPIGVEVAPNGRQLYVINRDDSTTSRGNGGVSGYNIGANGVLTRFLGAGSAAAGTPFFTGGQQPHGLELIDQLPTFLYIGHESGRSIGAFNVNFNTGALSPVAGSPFGAGGVGDAHFSNASTTTGASSIVNRDGTLLRFLKSPRSGGQQVTVGATSTSRIFSTPKPRRIVPVPGSGCVPTEGSTVRSLICTTTNVRQVRVFTVDGDNTVNAQNGFPELVVCGSGFDTISLDLSDPAPFNCDRVTRAPRRVGMPARPAGRSARVRGRVAALRLRCARGRQDGRCRGRVTVRRGRRAIGSRRYSIRAGRTATVRVQLRIPIQGRRRVRVLTRERARDGRPMTGNSVLTLRGR